ncbi:MAG: site-specific integrase [Lachnospiraceae bacterium]|nr:site-specific integrase [Lachnospiraceae bacterium]
MELRLWAKDMLCKYMPNVKQYHRMIYPISQVFAYASDEDVGILDQDLWQRAKKKIDRNLIKPTPVPEDETQVFTDEERLFLRQMVIEDLEKYDYNPTSAGLQILLMLETGIRIGEACGLKWEDIVDGYIRIRRQADNNRVKLPKTAAAIRDIPLTDEAIRVLEMVRQYNEKHGLSGEWVFLNTDPNKYEGRLSYHAADRKLRKLCERMQAVHRSPHKLRKTFASLLKNSNVVTDRNIQRAMGHANISTTMNCYVFDQHKKEEQVESIKRALELERPDE